MPDQDAVGTLHIPARDIPLPSFLSDIAKAYLMPRPGSDSFPDLDDAQGWEAYVAAADEAVVPLLRGMGMQTPADVTERDADGARVFEIVPAG